MGRPDVAEVTAALLKAGLRAARAYPGERMPHIQRPVVAVALQKDTADCRILAVTVLCPESMGGGRCEEEAVRVAEILRGMGYRCTQEHCQYDGKGDRFSVRILAEWTESPADLPFSVSMGTGDMPYVVSFTAEHKVDMQPLGAMGKTEPVGFLGKEQPWTFILEEKIPRDAAENAEPAEPFEMVVRRGTVGEIFSGCRWISHYRKDTQDGLYQVRNGIAGERSVVDYG